MASSGFSDEGGVAESKDDVLGGAGGALTVIEDVSAGSAPSAGESHQAANSPPPPPLTPSLRACRRWWVHLFACSS